ncbi:hypothetical protein [Mangrovicoccus algicola]|uniref:Uncharacterized protein n=1 Tax=Mangrovicoccus algicola TaxID=2771008 RepID=A0A8J6YY19_9RHOB|nr:hypothetical protein [Mangrovicoccus algicola]MBE3637853.1 hypothetical protein [Mangrovicoccus algicola]
MTETSLSRPWTDAVAFADLEIRRLRQAGPGLLEVDVSLILQERSGLTARNLTLTVPEQGAGSLHDRLCSEARLMLGASLRIERCCFGAMMRHARPDAA